jgi:ABC-type uncharacterized transport system substrate-binding protein
MDCRRHLRLLRQRRERPRRRRASKPSDKFVRRIGHLSCRSGFSAERRSKGHMLCRSPRFEGVCEKPALSKGKTWPSNSGHADGQCERLPELATDLFRRQVAVIVAIGASTPALAATAATATVPVVFATASDATQIGLVNSLKNPQADPTGMSFATPGTRILASKCLDLLLELRYGARLVGYLDNSCLSEAFETNVASLTTAASIHAYPVFTHTPKM